MPRNATPAEVSTAIAERIAGRVESLLAESDQRSVRKQVVRTSTTEEGTLAEFDLAQARDVGLRVEYASCRLTLRRRNRRADLDLSEYWVDSQLHANKFTLHLTPWASEPAVGQNRPTLQSAFLRQAVAYLGELTRAMDDEALSGVLGERSAGEAIVRALQSPATVNLLRQEDPLLHARMRGVVERDRLLQAAGGALEPADVVKLLGITRQAVDKRRRERKLLALPRGGTRFFYPAAQFARSGTVRDLERFLAEIGDVDPWAVLSFLVSTNDFLDGRRPIDVLEKEGIAGIVGAIRAREEQGPA